MSLTDENGKTAIGLPDPRANPYRDDIAADYLEGKVEAARFVAGAERRLGLASQPVMSKPDESALQSSELLFGEDFTAYEEKDGWTWGQCGHDGYVGYVRSTGLYSTLPEATHWVQVLRSLVFPDNKGEYPPSLSLPMMSRVTVEETDGDYVRLASGGWMFASHLLPFGDTRPDFVATASMFSRVPYLWGGRGGQGIDCSGLIQVSLAAAGILSPRDADQQAAAIGDDIPVPENLSDLKPGDVVFFPGHVGIHLAAGAFLHASSHDMMVATHSLTDVVARMRERFDRSISRVRRVKSAGG